MGRSASKTTPVNPGPKANEAAFQEAESAARELAVMDINHAASVKAVALQMGYDGPLDADLIQRDISMNMRRSVEACLEVGKGLRVLKEACQHGNFVARLEVLGLDHTVAIRFMQAASKFSKAATSQLLAAAGNQSKLLELLVLDDEQIAELELTGQTGELELDKIAKMGVRELRAALRQSEKDAEFEADKRQKAEARADTAEKKLRGRTPHVAPLDERITPFQVEIAERHSLLEKCILADVEAVKALEVWWLQEGSDDPNYDPEAHVPMPASVRAVLLHLADSVERTARLVGALQHTLNETFCVEIAAARQHLLIDPDADAAGQGG